jgi:hypothetical protein
MVIVAGFDVHRRQITFDAHEELGPDDDPRAARPALAHGEVTVRPLRARLERLVRPAYLAAMTASRARQDRHRVVGRREFD